jgi:hypothetical protein
LTSLFSRVISKTYLELQLKAQSTGWDNELFYRRCSSADSENECAKNYNNFIRGRAQLQKCSTTLAPIQFQAILISHFELHILPKVSKPVGLLAKTLKNVF